MRCGTYLRWDHRHDEMAAQIMREFGRKPGLVTDRAIQAWYHPSIA
jgi:hypothetical protein